MNPFENAGLSCRGASTSELIRKGIGPVSEDTSHREKGESRTAIPHPGRPLSAVAE